MGLRRIMSGRTMSVLSRARFVQWLPACVLALLAFTPGVQGQAAMSPADRNAFNQAVAEMDAGQTQQAEPELRRLIQHNPANGEINEALGLLYAGRGELERALPYFEQASKSEPRSAVNRANLGAAWLKLDRPRQAAAELKIAAALDPNNGQTLSSLGQAYMLLHDAADAATVFARAARLEPANADLLYNWAVALNQTGRAAQAEKALAQIPEGEMSDQAESLAGDVEETLGHFLPAVAHYRKAADENPSEDNLDALCVEYLRHWAWDDAQKIAEYGTARYPESKRLKLELGVALYGAKKFPEAAAEFAALLDADPDNKMFAEMLGHTCGELAGDNTACAALEGFAAQHPGNAAAAVYAAAHILDRPHTAGDLDLAESWLVRAMAADPTMADGWYELGVLYAERADWPQCARALEKAVALRPDFASAHYQLAAAYGHLNNPVGRKRELSLFQAASAKEKQQVSSKVKDMMTFVTNPR
jgi:tetratricopeptide (TPR) repeat protein